MPVPAPNLHPDFAITRAAHTELTVTDLGAGRAFYADLLGLNVTHEDGSMICLRAMEERCHHSLVLRLGKRPACGHLGFRLAGEDEVDRAAAHFAAQGRQTSWVERPFQGRTLRVADPHGIPLEFYFEMELLASIHQNYALYHGARPLRIDHFNCFSPNVDESVAFYNGIGFRTTEYTEDGKSGRLWAAWMHRKGGVHDIAFTNGTGPRLHHLAYWVASPMNIIDLLDLMATTGHVDSIERGPGRHGIANAFFVYVLDADGHRTELYCSDYQTVDSDHEPIHWDLADPQRQTLWGAPAPKSWFEHGIGFADVPSRAPDLAASPIVAP